MKTLKEKIYNLGIDIIAFFLKIGLFLYLPFKFIQFWREAWKKNSRKAKDLP